MSGNEQDRVMVGREVWRLREVRKDEEKNYLIKRQKLFPVGK